MIRKKQILDDDSQPIKVPRNDKGLVSKEPERVQRLREHLLGVLRDLRKSKHLQCFASPDWPQPSGFQALVARSACSLCKGWCCRNGHDDAFLDDRTLARVRLARPDATEHTLLRSYLDCVPPLAYRDSCIFHGKHGCTLDRSMRAEVCNTYYCGELGAFMQGAGNPGPIVVIAGEGDNMRTSPVLVP